MAVIDRPAVDIGAATPNVEVPGLIEKITLVDPDDYEWLKRTRHVYSDGGVLAPRAVCGPCGKDVSAAAAFMIMDGKPTSRTPCCIETARVWIADVESVNRMPAKDVLKSSASLEAGSIAWVATDEDDLMLAYGFGVLEAAPYGVVTNNMTELLAMMQIVRRLPYGWRGTALTDSNITRGRFSEGWKLRGIPQIWFEMFGETLRRIDVAGTTWTLLQGHPLVSELERMRSGEKGVIGSKRGLPVSLHQHFCDELCNLALASYRERMRG